MILICLINKGSNIILCRLKLYESITQGTFYCGFGIQYVSNAEVRCSSLKVHNIDLGLEIQRKPKEKG